MAASDHIGEHIIRVYHAARTETPPHIMRRTYLQEERNNAQWAWDNNLASTNVHPDIIHAGTYQSALDIRDDRELRSQMHAYDIDTREMSPITYDDSPKMDETNKFKRNMAGVQQSLWESIPSTGQETLMHGRVQPYRNKAEDAGSISYMIPKSAIGTSRAKYAGVSEINREAK
jgi:hypothetical protein